MYNNLYSSNLNHDLTTLDLPKYKSNQNLETLNKWVIKEINKFNNLLNGVINGEITLQPTNVNKMLDKNIICEHVNKLACSYTGTESDILQNIKNSFFLCKDLLGNQFIKNSYKEDLTTILKLCLELGFNQEETSVTLRVGFGGSLAEPTTRVPTYAIAALKTMEIFNQHKESGLISTLPKLEFIFANKLATVANNFDQEMVAKNTDATKNLLKSFIHVFCPKISPSVDFTTDQFLNYPDSDEANIQMIRLFNSGLDEKLIRQQTQRINTGHITTGGGSNIDYNLYFVAHAKIFDDLNPNQNHYNWSFGGRGEEIFIKLRKLLREETNSQSLSNAIMTIQKTGHYPPYYSVPGSDVNINEFSETLYHQNASSISNKYIELDFQLLAKFIAETESNLLGVNLDTNQSLEMLKTFYHEYNNIYTYEA